MLHGCHESLSKDKRRYTSERGSVDGNGDGDGDGADVAAGSTGDNPPRLRGPHALAIAFLHAPVGRYGYRISKSRSPYLPSFPLISASPILVHYRRSSGTQYKFIKHSACGGSCGAFLTGLRDLVFLDRSDHAFGFQEEAGRTEEQSLHSAHCSK